MPFINALDSQIHYLDSGTGTPFVFLHGNPTSSYLWRHVLAAFDGPDRRLAPDLIGMGQSGKPDIDYRFRDHARYLDAWFDNLELNQVVLVGHDWGGALAFHWARRHPERVRGIAFLETIVRPMLWSEFPSAARETFTALRTPGVGERLVLDENLFIEQALPATVATGLAEADLAVYRAPYPTPESRRPLLQWPRELPLDGEPADTVSDVLAYDEWLTTSSDVPKLLFAFDPGPGTMLAGPLIDWCTTSIASLEVAHCGAAGHHAPEDQPTQIAAALAAWADKNGLR